MEQINLNLIPNGVNPVAHCKQYDVGRTFRCNLFEGNAVYTLDGSETVECEVHKPDGNLVTLALTNTGSTYVDVVTTLQMCACSGESLAAIKITSGGVELGSLNFVLYCERSPLEGGVTSDSEIYNLETQVSSLVATEVANQYDSANVIFDSEPTAGHGNGYAVTSEGIVDYVNPEETIENVAIASFSNGGDGVPVKELIVGIEPVQASGTPTPDSPLAITGWSNANITRCGLNLWNEEWEAGNIDGTGANSSANDRIRSKGYIQVKGVTSVYLVIPTAVVVHKYDINKSYLGNNYVASSGSFSIASDVAFIRFRTDTSYGATYNNDISINYPSTDTTYHAYNGTTSTISLGQTVYGGELNVTTGELTITHNSVLVNGSQTISTSTGNRFYISIPAAFPVNVSNQVTYAGVRSEMGSSTSWAKLADPDGDLKCAPVYGNGIAFRDDTKTTVSDWTTYFTNNPTRFVYELATPTTTTLTPTEVATVLGYNNIYADTGDVVSVTYIKDTASAIYPIVEDKLADKVDKIPSGYQSIYGTWSPAFNGRCYLSCLFFPTSSSILAVGYYSTDGTTMVATNDTFISSDNNVMTIFTTDTACAGCVAKIMFALS